MLWFAQRVRELQEALSATIAREISSRNARVAALQKCWDGLRAGLDVILDQGVDMADLPGRPQRDTAPGLQEEGSRSASDPHRPRGGRAASRVAGHERQAAEESGQRKTRVEEPKPLDASSAAITLAMFFTVAEVEEMERKALELEKSRGADNQVGSAIASPQPAPRHGEPAQVFPANAAAADGRPRMDGVICYFAVWPSGSLLRLPASLLAIAFTGQCLLDAEFLAWLQIEGVPLDFPDDILLHNLSLEAAERVLHGLAVLEPYLSQTAPPSRPNCSGGIIRPFPASQPFRLEPVSPSVPCRA
jgi:hypothetical protein